jgi:hypothetical protein
MPGNGHDRASARKDAHKKILSARKKKEEKSPIVKVTLGKIISVALKYLIFAMQNSPRGTPQE